MGIAIGMEVVLVLAVVLGVALAIVAAIILILSAMNLLDLGAVLHTMLTVFVALVVIAGLTWILIKNFVQ